MNKQALHLFLSVLLYNMLHVEASSSTYHHIQVGGPDNKITTGEIRIDLPSESFQNLKFNITPYSLQSEYSPYYDQYSTGYQPSLHSQPKAAQYRPIPSKQPLQLVNKSPVKLSYKPRPQEIYNPLPSIPKPIYSYPHASYKQPSYTSHKVSYSKPSYSQPKESYIQPSYTVSKASYTHVQSIPPSNPQNTQSYQRPVQVLSFSPVKTAASTKLGSSKLPSEGDYFAYPYPYQHTGYTKYDTKEDEDGDASKGDIKEEGRSGNPIITTPVGTNEISKISEENEVLDETEIILSEVFTSSSQQETNLDREPKNVDFDVDDSNSNSIDSIAATTLLPSVVPIVFDDIGVSTLNENILSTEPILESTNTTSTIQPTTERIVPDVTTESLVRRRPVVSFFRDVTTSTQAPSIAIQKQSDERGQLSIKLFNSAKQTKNDQIIDSNKSDKLKIEKEEQPTSTFTAESTFQDITTSAQTTSTETITPPEEAGQFLLNLLGTADKENTDVAAELSELENDDTGVRNRRKVLKVIKSKPTKLGFNQNYHWQDGRWF